MMLEPLGPRGRPGGADARMARTLCRARLCGRSRRSIRSTPRASASSSSPGGTIVGSAPVGHDGTAAWLEAIGAACNVAPRQDRRRQEPLPAGDQGGAGGKADRCAASRVSGYEGSELLVARLLIESGADVPYVGTACPRTPWSDPDREWLEAKGARVQYRASLEQDLAACRRVQAGSRHRHHAGGAEGQAAGDPGAVFHQPDLGAAAVRRRPAPARWRRSSTRRSATRPLRRDDGVLRRGRRRPRRRRLGRHAEGQRRVPGEIQASRSKPRPRSARPRR